MRKHRRHGNARRSVLPLPVKIIIAVALVIFIIIIIPSGSSATGNAEASAIRARGVLRVALSDVDNMFATADNKGIEAELANRIAQKIFDDTDTRTRLDITRIAPSFMGTYFSDASIDIALMQCPNGLYSSKYAYSKPYYTDKCLIIIDRDADASSSLNGMNIGVIKNSICEIRLNSYVEKNDISIKTEKYTTYEIMLNALKAHKIDACVLTGTEYKSYGSGNLRAHNTELDTIGYCVVCNTENSAILNVVDQVIDEYLNK